MRFAGQLSLCVSLICAGYAAFVYLLVPKLTLGTTLPLGTSRQPPDRLHRISTACGLAAWVALTGVVVTLICGLLTRDFSFDYVARYSSRLLSWPYALSALWVGQAGSLLLWAWILATLALLFRVMPTPNALLRDTAFGVLMAYLTFLIGLMIFAADPCQANLVVRQEGLGLSPLLQHPSMLIHPPVIFLAYAAWTVPFALAAAALWHNRLDETWTQMARPWALFAWTVLGIGLLLGAHWAYQELGWGGYWGWDPVENGSLLPWLTGTAFIHCLMAWRYRQCLKKSALALGIVTFGLCNFATFLTRSGIFSSVHAFSESPIGWMFLALMALLLLGGTALVAMRRESLAPERSPGSLLARETLILVSTSLLVVLTLVVLVSTLVVPLSTYLRGQTIQVTPSFYNNALVPVGLTLAAMTAVAPLLRWGAAPGPAQRRALCVCLIVGLAAMGVGYWLGIQHLVSLLVTAWASVAGAAFLGALVLDAQRRSPGAFCIGLWRTVRDDRRQYTGYIVHLGFMVLAIGITGSSLGSRRYEIDMDEGASVTWANREIRYVRLDQRTLSDKLIAEAVLEVSRNGQAPVTMRPARHLHLLQNEWTTEVDIHSAWSGDFYAILHAGLGDGKVALTFVENPMMAWIWLGGLIISVSALSAMVPTRRGQQAAALVDNESERPALGAVDNHVKKQAA